MSDNEGFCRRTSAGVRQRTNTRIGPEIQDRPEPDPEGPSTLERLFEMSSKAVRVLPGYGDPEIEKHCRRGEINKATFLGYVMVAHPVLIGSIATVATNSLAGDGFSLLRCGACFGVSDVSARGTERAD
jgi:hypothetical protein